MLDEKMKLEEYFKEEIQRVSDIQISGIEREIEQIRKKTIASLEQAAQMEAGLQRDNELREMQSEHAIALSRLHEETNRKLMQKRKQLNEAVFAEVKKQMLAYCESDAYLDLLLEKLNKQKNNAQEHAILHMAKKDERYMEKLCEAYGHGCIGEIDESIVIGGFLLVYEDSGIVIDETFDTAIEEQRSWFYNHSGLFIK